MSRALTSATTLDQLKREAKQWLKALRTGDPEARARLLRAHPGAPPDAGLRHVQHALAREFGFASWARLKAVAPVDERAPRLMRHATRPPASRRSTASSRRRTPATSSG